MDQGEEPGPRRRGRGGPGLAFGSSGPGVETKQKAKAGKAKAKAERTLVDDTVATASASTTVPATASARVLPDAASQAATSQSSKTKGLRPLDSEMTIVASKHTGSSAKCLHGLVASSYLDEPREKVSRHTLAANLRGVTWLFAIRTFINCHFFTEQIQGACDSMCNINIDIVGTLTLSGCTIN